VASKLRKMYNGTLRAIGGLAPHANMMAACRLLGWEGNLALAVKLRVGFYDRVMRQPAYMKVRKLMEHRMRSLPESIKLDGGGGAYVPGTSTFCWDTYQALRLCLGKSVAEGHRTKPARLGFTTRKVAFPAAVKRAVATHLRASFAASGSRSWYYFPTHCASWEMAPYLKAVKDGQQSRDHLRIMQIQTGGHALGEAIVKVYCPVGPVFCVACLGPCSDSPPHQFHRCMPQHAVGARREWEPRLIQVMRPSVSWCKLYAKSTSPLERTCLILSCGEYLTCEARVRLASTIVGGWVAGRDPQGPPYACCLRRR
jgi:hypothetical protein